MKSLVLLFILILCIACEKIICDNVTPMIRDESYYRNYYTNIDKDSLVVFQWNIGHFSNGNLTYSDISQDHITMHINSYKSLLGYFSPDIISLNEYSDVMGIYDNKQYFTRDILCNDYDYAYIGIQNNYSCNAIISHFPMTQVRYNIFECNKYAQITHTSIIRADEYYYLSSIFKWQDETINFISTHLAFDNNNTEIAKAQIKELISKYSNCDYVIMCGDWNTSPESYYLFEDNGYELLNCGEFGQHITFPSSSMYLDNILVKGISIQDIDIIETDLSDHYPIMCTIRLKDN